MGGILRFAPPRSDEQQHSSLDTAESAADHEVLLIPQTRVIAVEHPCVVKHVDRAIQALGGERHIKHIVNDESSTLAATTSLRPHDPFAKQLVSKLSPVQHVLIRLTVPKKTGRKRKRGSDAPFSFHEHDRDASWHAPGYDKAMPLTAPQVLRRLDEQVGGYQAVPVGLVPAVHKFRGLPDFQHLAQSHGLSRKIIEQLGAASLPQIKGFFPDMRVTSTTPESLPRPPTFAAHDQQMYYGYAQTGQRLSAAASGAMQSPLALPMSTFRRRQEHALPHDVETIPDRPPPGLLPLEDANDSLKEAVRNLNAVLDERPVVTRRAAMNMCPDVAEDLFKTATEYCGYSFKSGPWRDTLVRFGLDPRASPQYRQYQTLAFQLSSKDQELTSAKRLVTGSSQWLRSYKVARGRRSIRMEASGTGVSPVKSADRVRQGSLNKVEDGTQVRSNDPLLKESQSGEADDYVPSHIFDGHGLGTNNKTFQLVDVVDPLLRSVLDAAPVRKEVHPTWGWYTNGSLALVRVLMREKMTRLLAAASGEGDVEGLDVLFTRVIEATPHVLDKEEQDGKLMPDTDGLSVNDKKYLSTVMSHIRALAKTDKVGPSLEAQEQRRHGFQLSRAPHGNASSKGKGRAARDGRYLDDHHANNDGGASANDANNVDDLPENGSGDDGSDRDGPIADLELLGRVDE